MIINLRFPYRVPNFKWKYTFDIFRNTWTWWYNACIQTLIMGFHPTEHPGVNERFGTFRIKLNRRTIAELSGYDLFVHQSPRFLILHPMIQLLQSDQFICEIETDTKYSRNVEVSLCVIGEITLSQRDLVIILGESLGAMDSTQFSTNVPITLQHREQVYVSDQTIMSILYNLQFSEFVQVRDRLETYIRKTTKPFRLHIQINFCEPLQCNTRLYETLDVNAQKKRNGNIF